MGIKIIEEMQIIIQGVFHLVLESLFRKMMILNNFQKIKVDSIVYFSNPTKNWDIKD